MLDKDEKTWYNPDIETSEEENKEDNTTMWRESLTNHGFKRMRERAKVKGAKAEDYTERVLRKGKRIEDFTSSKFKTYLTNVKNTEGGGREVVVFGNEIYVFSQNWACITVLKIPPKLLSIRK